MLEEARAVSSGTVASDLLAHGEREGGSCATDKHFLTRALDIHVTSS